MVKNLIAPPTSIATLRQTWRDNALEAALVSHAIPGLPDGEGGFLPDTTVETEYPATRGPLGQASTQERIIQERYQGEDLSVIQVPHDAVVSAHDTVILNGVDRYEVVGLVPRTTFQVKRNLVVRFRGTIEAVPES